MNTREQDLAACLLWLRNHYDVGRSRCKPQVLDRVDRVLADGEDVTITTSTTFKEKYPCKL